MASTEYENTAKVVDDSDEPAESSYYQPTEADKKLTAFVIDHTDRWREYRDQNFMDDWLHYERIWRGKYDAGDKMRESERSRVISPATQQAVETRHAEIMEAIFGQGEYFDIDGEINDPTGGITAEKLKTQLYEDFKRDKFRKSVDQIALLAEIYGTGIGEIVVGEQQLFTPMSVPVGATQMAYGVGQQSRIFVKVKPVNPKNFLFDPNGVDVDDCMGVAVERYTSIHKIAANIKSGKYQNVDISSMYVDESLEPTQEDRNYEDEKVLVLTYYGLVPTDMLSSGDENVVKLFNDDDDCDVDEYTDMTEVIVVIANGDTLLKCEPSPYMMKDRPVISYQADTVPNRLLGRGTVEKAFNMQMAIDGSMRSHMDALALTVAPMIAMDSTRLPRGAKFEVKPGKMLLTNGPPAEIAMPFSFGSTDGAAMTTSKEFERMLLMATSTVDSAGTPSQVNRDGNLDMSTATMIKKYKRVLTNFQEDFLIPFINKAAWRYMQFAPERYPSVDPKFIPTAVLGIIAREYEQKQLAFLIQTLGAQSPLAPILMTGILKNSSISNREQMIQQLQQMSQPNPQQEMMQSQAAQKAMQMQDAEIAKRNAETQQIEQETRIAPVVAQARMIAALSNNLANGEEDKDFERRSQMAELMLKQQGINSNHEIAMVQAANDRMRMHQDQQQHNDKLQSDLLQHADKMTAAKQPPPGEST